MPANEYRFATVWKVEGTAGEVFDVIDDAAALPRWWPSVYLEVTLGTPGDARGVGRVVHLFTKGWLPYTLRWSFRVTDKVRPERLALEAWGDLQGTGVWDFTPRGNLVEARYDWRVRADKPLLRYLSAVFRPVFAANHRWAMARGEESLVLELARRRASNDADRARVPAPPGPTFRRPAPG